MVALLFWLFDLARDLLSKTELLAALLGAAVGGQLTSRAADRQMRNERELTLEQMRHERELTRENAEWATGTAAVREMLDPLETMRAVLDDLGGINRAGKRVSYEHRGRADTALNRMEWLGRTHATLLPPELSNRWYWATELPRQYRTARAKRGTADAWSGQKLSRAYDDVNNYMGYVRTSLATYVRTGKVDTECEPPVLRRDDMASWQPC